MGKLFINDVYVTHTRFLVITLDTSRIFDLELSVTEPRELEW